MNNFLGFFKSLSAKSPEHFRKLIADYCEVKTVKSASNAGKPSLEKAEIMLKEAVFAEVKKTIVGKERGVFK